ncbi:MAG: DMT family transporter, partial [Gemmatimonadales bacterium]
MKPAKTAGLTALALSAFAANSVLCRLALAGTAIDPGTFTTIRLVAGAITLGALVRARSATTPRSGTSWLPALLLFLYAVPFSFAYVSLSTGTGALLLFGTVQVTMILISLRREGRPRPTQWVGLAVAFGGLVYLLLPGVTAPSLSGATLMIVAGMAWGFYSFAGRGVPDPLAQTATNFARTVPMALVLLLLTWSGDRIDWQGGLLAVTSGAIASGVGYVLWYQALRGLSGMTAAIVQLTVPVIAAASGTVLLSEPVTFRLGLAGALVLGGIGLALQAGL